MKDSSIKTSMADIPFEQPENPDIYSYGFDKLLNRAISDESTGVVYDSLDKATNASSVLSGGNIILKTITIGGLTKQIAPGDDIQAAIDAVNREGGGTIELEAKIYLLKNDLNLRSNVIIVGAGRGITILDFEGQSFGVKMIGTSTSLIENVVLRDFTIQNSNNAAGIDIDFSDFWSINNIRIFSCDQIGLRIQRSQSFTIINGLIDNNTGDGIDITGGTRSTQQFVLTNVISKSNTGIGFDIDSDNQGTILFSLINCIAKDNISDGFEISGAVAMYSSFINCISDDNNSNGFDITSSTSNFIGCIALINTLDGFLVRDRRGNLFVGCSSQNNTGNNFDIQVGGNLLLGCNLESSSTGPDISFTEDNFQSVGNVAGSTRTEKKILEMKNNSGATLLDGAVVILDSIANGDNITTTTTNGSNKVFGMSVAATSNSDYGVILVEGNTTSLLVTNGTSSIAIGDWLSTYSHAYYAKKAVAGDMVFAMALAAPTTSTASIAALLVNPRLI